MACSRQAEFELPGASATEGVAYVQTHPAEITQLIGAYLDHMAGLEVIASSLSFSERL